VQGKNTSLIVVGAHPDDAELGCGGLIAKLSDRGHRVGIIDLTAGEMGSSGDAETRMAEAEKAGEILGVSFRENLGLPDSRLQDTIENRMRLAELFRKLRPRMVATCHGADRHPDHCAAASLVSGASLHARLKKAPLEGDIHCVERVFHFAMHEDAVPSFITDITEQFDRKKLALESYVSQFVRPETEEGYRYIGVKDYIGAFTARAAYYGSLIGTEYAEAFILEGVLSIDSPEEVLLDNVR